jgi:hypothetical protein
MKHVYQNHMNLIHALIPCSKVLIEEQTIPQLLTHFNIIPSMPNFPKQDPSWLTHENLVCTSLLPIHATCPTHLILHDLITQIISGEQYKSSTSFCNSLRLPCTSKYLLQHPSLKRPQPMFLCSSLRVTE